ncbi:uncharacterized protein ACRADG_000571 [Cochliomyia hominivorax]
MPVTDVSNMKVADLKRELKVRGLSVAGNKTELQERLQAAMVGEPLLEDSSLVGEDILDEEGVLSDEEKILGSDENELLKSPTTTPTTILPKTLGSDNKDAAAIEDDILESPTATNKKVILKRKSSINNSGNTLEVNSTTKENTEPSPAKASKMSERNPITMGDDKKSEGNQTVAATKKLKELTMQERLELRAKKFGLETSKTTTIPATAAMTAKEKNAAISVAPVVSSEKQVELLKKRAERFGCVTSTNLAKLDAEERLLKRKQRFGGADVTANKEAENKKTNTTAVTSETKDEWAEKARKRLERFKGQSTPATTVAATPVANPTNTPSPAATATASSN